MAPVLYTNAATNAVAMFSAPSHMTNASPASAASPTLDRVLAIRSSGAESQATKFQPSATPAVSKATRFHMRVCYLALRDDSKKDMATHTSPAMTIRMPERRMPSRPTLARKTPSPKSKPKAMIREEM